MEQRRRRATPFTVPMLAEAKRNGQPQLVMLTALRRQFRRALDANTST